MRLLGGLGLLAPISLLVVWIAIPGAIESWTSALSRSIIAAVVAGMMGVSLTAGLVFMYVRLRLGRLLNAAERLAAGELDVEIGSTGRMRGLEGRLARAIDSISVALSETTNAATYDKLTGVSNRQSLLLNLFAEVERSNRYERPLSVAFVDIDHFKNVNDTYGHAAGDLVLRAVAQEIKAHLRVSDQVGRYGGEEFMLLLTETDVEEGAALTEKLRNLVARQKVAIADGQEVSVTISIGIAGGKGGQLRSDDLVRDADAAMYSAKSLGRNQTYIFSEPDEDARVPRAPISATGRAMAAAVGKAARDAATASLTSVISPLPHYRGQPSALIASIVVAMARNLDLPDGEVDRIRTAALLHDVGKVAVPQDILDKPAALSSAEWRTVVQHPRIGQVILEQAGALKDAVPIILHHHERYSGHGYPFGLRGSEIPLGARIVSIADAYDAMTHDRPYKRAMSHDNAIKELRRHAGTQFDPELVSLFCDLFARVAPVPDPAILAMTAPAVALEAVHTPRRRRRRSTDLPEPTIVASEGQSSAAGLASPSAGRFRCCHTAVMAPGDTARLYHRLSSFGPARDSEQTPINHPLVVQDFTRMDLLTEPPRCKVYPHGLPEVALPREWPAVDVPATAVLAGRRVAPPSNADGSGPIDLATLARLLHLSAGIVRTDVHRGRTMLFRAAGSAGGCFPTEIHVSARGVTGLPDAVYWFDPLNHALRRVAPAAGGEATVLVVTGVPWRTTWKYAERGLRHLYWDAGTMLAQTLAVAESSGLAPRLWTRFPDTTVARLVGADGIHEVPIALVGLGSGALAIEPTGAAALASVDARTRLFPLVTLAHRAGYADDLGDPGLAQTSVEIQPSPSADLDTVILQRGSARRMNPDSMVSREVFDFALAAALGGTRLPSFVVANGIEGVEPGIYRWPDLAEPIRRGNLREELLWVCWDMDLARDAAFVVLSAVDLASVDDRGYREAQIEAGLVEGRLHLAAYALGIGASGMTFLDSEIEALVGEPLAGLLFTCVGVPTYRNTAGGGPGKPVAIATPASGETPARPPDRGSAGPP